MDGTKSRMDHYGLPRRRGSSAGATCLLSPDESLADPSIRPDPGRQRVRRRGQAGRPESVPHLQPADLPGARRRRHPPPPGGFVRDSLPAPALARLCDRTPWLPTEAEQVRAFEALGINLRLLPLRVYRGAVGETRHYFPLKLPIALEPGRVVFSLRRPRTGDRHGAALLGHRPWPPLGGSTGAGAHDRGRGRRPGASDPAAGRAGAGPLGGLPRPWRFRRRPIGWTGDCPNRAGHPDREYPGAGGVWPCASSAETNRRVGKARSEAQPKDDHRSLCHLGVDTHCPRGF